MMKVPEVLHYTREYLGRGLGLENSICIPQEQIDSMKKSIGGLILGSCDLEYTPNRNHRVSWVPADTLERFRKNKQDPRALKCLKHFGWCDDGGTPTDIRYDLNSEGFRITDDYSEEGIVFYGCSHTFGIGLKNEDTFPQIVSDNFKLANFNFGIPGAGLDAAVMHALFLLPHVLEKPKAIVVLNPPPRRWNFFHGHRIRSATVQLLKPNPTNDDMAEMGFQSVTNDMNNLIQTAKNIITLQTIAQEMNVPFFLVDWAHGFTREYRAWHYYDWRCKRGTDSFEGISMARDLHHPGIDTHKAWARDMIKILSRKL